MSEQYLLDTSIVSEFSPGRRTVPAKVATWLAARSPRFHLSTVSVAEIERGISQSRREGAERRAGSFSAWLDEIIFEYADRLLAFDTDAAQIAGRLADQAVKEGIHPGFADVAIAATASAHRLTILTRNLKHFIPLGVPCLDPFYTKSR